MVPRKRQLLPPIYPALIDRTTLYIEAMYTFGQMENVGFLFDEVEVLEAAIACELNAQDADAARIVSEIQVDIDASEKEIARHHEIITTKHAEREKRVAAVREEGRERLEELQRKLADAKHELSVINSPILVLPYEATAEIFHWHMLMGGGLTSMLLVCKRWSTVAYNSPRLWSRIAVTDRSADQLRLQGAVRCGTLDHLRSVLSLAKSSPLQIEFFFSPYPLVVNRDNSSHPSSLWWGFQAASNRKEAIKIIFDGQILRRCTSLVLGNVSFHYQGPLTIETVLPLLSSLHIDDTSLYDHEIHLIQSLIKVSPSLRHIRCRSSNLSPQHLGVGMWVKRIESYGWVYASNPCPLPQECPSLRQLGIIGDLGVPLTLPVLQVLRWQIHTSIMFHLITAPNLHTLILSHRLSGLERPSAGAITLPKLRVAIHYGMHDLASLHVFRTPALEHLSIQSATLLPTALFELFDGSDHMPAPKSLHLECAFSDAALIAVLGRLPWLEELQIAGTIAQDAFWEGLTPSRNPSWRVWLPTSYPDERATRVLTPNLKFLLINYSVELLYTPPKPQVKKTTRRQRTQVAQAVQLPDDGPRGGEWTVVQASAVADARGQAGCPLETLACWSPEREVKVLIGNLDTVLQRPT